MSTKLKDLRSCFLNYFQAHDHLVIPSSTLVPQNDPTLLFTNSGMVQFKNIFLQKEMPRSKMVTSVQKCLRAGGKHNDLDEVGFTARHLTFFEMLGNFSFGGYFKEQAIYFAWDFVTRTLSLPKDKLYITVYAEDVEAKALWKKIAGLEDSRIIEINSSANFWQMADTGPCGPCSEIFYDQGESVYGGLPGTATEDGDRYLEVWNLVFMQYERLPDGTLKPLQTPCIDTGMGIERLAAIMQGVSSNFEIDLFQRIIDETAQKLNRPIIKEDLSSFRIISDHLRAIAFLIVDGVVPGSEGRSYVLRRIMRRAIRQVEHLGVHEPVLYDVIPVIVQEMGKAYPALKTHQLRIIEILKNEEVFFRKTLTKGLKLLQATLSDHDTTQPFPGKTAFMLYDTYGFPIDITQDIVKSAGCTVDVHEFEESMEQQRLQARQARIGRNSSTNSAPWENLTQLFEPTEFLGYEHSRAEGKILKLYNQHSAVKTLEKGQEGVMIVTQTPFYAEAGGQTADIGVFESHHAKGVIYDTQKTTEGLYLHFIRLEEGVLSCKEVISLEVDSVHRAKLKANHTATHLLHESLRRVLGDSISQKGSYVSAERLRFDFNHASALTLEQLGEVETMINQTIIEDCAVTISIMPYEEAKKLNVKALFNEKYGPYVRVVSVEERTASGEKLEPFSRELCGGLHVKRTGNIGQCILVYEGGIKAGVRRIEALTGEAARLYRRKESQDLKQILSLLKVSQCQAPLFVDKLLKEHRKALQEIKMLRQNQLEQKMTSSEKTIHIKEFQLIADSFQNVEIENLRSLVDKAKQRIKSGIVVFSTCLSESKVTMMIGITKDLEGRYDARALIRIATPYLNGKGGGGRWDLAQGGGDDVSGIKLAVKRIIELIKEP